MKAIKLSALVFSILSTSAYSAVNLESIIPKKSLSSDLLELGFNRKTDVLKDKLIADWKKNPQLQNEMMKNAKPGQPIKYDKRLSMSEKDFNLLVGSLVSGGGIEVRTVGKSEIQVVNLDANNIKLFNNKSELLSKGVVLNLQNEELKLSDSTSLGLPKSFENLSSASMPSEGYSWKLRDNQKGMAVKITISRMKDPTYCLITTTHKELDSTKRKLKMNQDSFLRYRCPVL